MKENKKNEITKKGIKTIKLKKNKEFYGSSCSKLQGLIKKNLLILKRNKLTTLCEILFPIILMLLLLEVRNAFLIDEYNYIEDEQTTENFIKRRSVANVDLNNSDIILEENNSSFYWHNLSILPALSICSKFNRKRKERPLIASIGIPEEIKERIIYDVSFYKDKIEMNFTMQNFKEFKDINEMENYVKDKKFGTEEFPGICFGIKFEQNKWGYNYSLHYFDSIFGQGIQDLMNIIGGPIDLFKSGPDMQSYQKYRRTDNIKNIVPDYYMKASPAMVADDGADDPINVLTKILLDKQDRFKEGRDILCDPKFTQVGIAHEVFDDENMVILIFAKEYVEDEPKYDLPEGDLTELKRAFDILDIEGKGKLNMKYIMKNLDDIQLFKTDPTIYSIFNDMADRERCSWPKFATFVNARMTDRETKEGLGTIFNLLINDPDKGTIDFDTFKKLCNEIDCGLSEKQLNDILKASTNNGNEITFKEFEEYMSIPSQ